MADQTRNSFHPGIHGARGLFCILVVFYHIWNSGLARWPVPILLDQTMESFRYGVELFFAISGFVIFITMQPVLLGKASPFDFLANRATRIFPVLWISIIVFIPLGIMDGEPSVTAHLQPLWLFDLKLIGNFLALGPIWPVPVFYGVTWTIGYEFTFYSLCFVYLCGKFYWKRDLLWPVCLVGLALVLYHPRALFFLSGMLVAMGLFRSGPLKSFAVLPLLWLAIFLTAWQSMAAPVTPFFPPIPQWDIWSDWPTGIVAFASVTFAIAGIATGRGLFCRFLITRPMLWLGTISYSLYLWHPIVLGAVKFAMSKSGITTLAGDGAQFLLLVLALPTSLMMGYLSQVFIEKRLTNWLRRRVKWHSPKISA